jgi:hypothetical protein
MQSFSMKAFDDRCWSLRSKTAFSLRNRDETARQFKYCVRALDSSLAHGVAALACH